MVKKPGWHATQLAIKKHSQNLLIFFYNFFSFQNDVFLHVIKKREIRVIGSTHLICDLELATGQPLSQVWKLHDR